MTGTKSILLSKTAWSAVIATLTPILALISNLTGLDLNIGAELAQVLDTSFVVVQGVLAVIGLVGVMYGRIKAKKKIAVIAPVVSSKKAA